MHFQHSGQIWRDYPELVPGIVFAEGITHTVPVDAPVAGFTARARSRLAKPTRYRCASESLLRRFRKEGALPRLHPLVGVCNAVSLAFAIPVAVVDVSKITGGIEVRYAAGDEDYLTFSGQVEHPAPHEVVFADQARQVHARRWTSRQSGLSAVRTSTATALIVAEAMHGSAASDVADLIAAITGQLAAIWSITPAAALLSQSSPRIALADQPQ